MMEVTSEKILNLTLEIISLLTGEYYTVVRKICGKNVTPSSHSFGSDGLSRTQSPINKQKILDLINEMIKLLSGEVPIRYQDVTFHFTMEEWEYIDKHKEMYKDIVMEDHHNLISLVGFGNVNQDEELDPAVPSLNPLKSEVGEINGNIQGIAEEPNSFSMAKVADTTKTQYPSIAIEEKTTCHKGNITDCDSRSSEDQTMCGYHNLVEKTCSYNVMSISNFNIYTHSPQYSSTHIKEEPFLYDGVHLTNPNISIPIDNTQQHPTTCIKVENALCDEDLMDVGSSTITDCTQFMFSCIKKEPSNDGPLLDLNIYTPTDHTPYNFHIQEEPVSCDGRNHVDPDHYTFRDHTPQYPTNIKEEPVSYDGGNHIEPDSYTLTDQTPHCPTNIKEEPVSCDGGNHIDSDSYTLTDHTPHHPTNIKEEPVSCDKGNHIDPYSYTLTDHTLHYPNNIKEEPVSCDEDCADANSFASADRTQHLFTHIKKEPVSTNKLSFTDFGIHATIYSTQQCPSTSIKSKSDSYDCSTDHTQRLSKEELVLEKVSLLQKLEYSLPPKSVDNDICRKKNKEPEQNYNDLTISSKKNFYTIQQTTNSLDILYNCPECPECFTSNLDLVKHQIIHTGKMPFICPVCGRYFGRKSDLITHQITHGGNSAFGCSYCDLSFDTKSSLSIHEKTHEQKKPLPCPECGKIFPTKKRLTIHRQIHTNERPFKCPECGDKFKRKAHLQRHQRIHEKAKQQLTSKCGDLHGSEVEVSAHKTVYEVKKVFTCSECGECLEDRVELLNHQVKHSRPKSFQSSASKSFYNSKLELEVHHQLHTLQRPECPIHTEGAPFMCSDCGRCFRRKSGLITHQIRHGGIGAFGCPSCDLSFATKSSLSIHERTHVQKKPLPCPECGKIFPTKKRLTRHQQIHTNERPFKCYECGDTFKRKAHLQRHHQRIHEKAIADVQVWRPSQE